MQGRSLIWRGIRRGERMVRQTLSPLPNKQFVELDFWRRQLREYEQWYEGKIERRYGIPAPLPDAKVTQYQHMENAIRTWAAADINKYPNHLLLPVQHFAGKNLLDVGSGPIPYALAFTGCQIWGLDQLAPLYKKAGFPLDRYSERLTYLGARAENIPVKDHVFDAVISVNALDHVDDFPSAAKEIGRVLRPGGILCMEIHYHKPTDAEPWQLNDAIVRQYFGNLRIKKAHERPYTDLYPDAQNRDKETLVVWTNE